MPPLALPPIGPRTHTTQPGYPLDLPSYELGATTYRWLTQRLSVLTYSLSPALSHPTYREHGIKRCIHDPSMRV